jgi:hypothetical protein
MGKIITFPTWDVLPPLIPQPHEIHCIIVGNFLDWEVPRYETFSVFEHKWLDRIRGYRNRESYNYLNQTRDFYDRKVTLAIYGIAEMPQNVRWSKRQ